MGRRAMSLILSSRVVPISQLRSTIRCSSSLLFLAVSHVQADVVFSDAILHRADAVIGSDCDPRGDRKSTHCLGNGPEQGGDGHDDEARGSWEHRGQDQAAPDGVNRAICCLRCVGWRKILALKNIFCSFEIQIQCSCAILSDRESRRQEAYWLFALERVKCLGSKAQFYPNGVLKKLVLNRDAIGDHSIFRVHGIIEKQIVIRFDVAESILRRPMVGIKLEGIECQEETDI